MLQLLGLTILFGIPLRVFGLQLPEPVFPMAAAFAWAVIRPSVLAPFAVLLMGLFLDYFWGGPIDGAFGVLLFDGAVAVTNAGATTDLTAPGDGVNLPTLVSPPGGVVAWAPDKVTRAVATVTFR